MKIANFQKHIWFRLIFSRFFGIGVGSTILVILLSFLVFNHFHKTLVKPVFAASNFNTIEGYTDQTSVNIGGTISFYVSDQTSVPTTFHMEFYRTGYYPNDGYSMHKVQSDVGPITPNTQNNPDNTTYDSSTGLREAKWNATYTLTIPNTWTSGYYMIKLVDNTFPNDVYGWIPFVVRNDSQTADIVYVVPFATYQAYNYWGGQCLYGPPTCPNSAAVKVSFNRPYNLSKGGSAFWQYDWSTIRFLEKNGYNVTYATDVDMHTNPNLLNNRKAFLTDWHDEYWSKQMRNNMTSELANGKSFAFLSADSMFTQMRLESSPLTGAANRVMVVYRDANLDPNPDPTLKTVNWRDPPLNLPESALLGAGYMDINTNNQLQPMIANNTNHWAYAGTGLNNGNTVANIVGPEWDNFCAGACGPSNTVQLSNSLVTNNNNVSSYQNTTIYNTGSNGSGPYVFDAGTENWALGLDYNPAENVDNTNPKIQQMTNNVLYRMIHGIPSSSYVSTVKNDNPVSYWRLSDWNTTTTRDQMSAHNGTYYNNPSLGQAGALPADWDTAASFNGSNQSVGIPFSTALSTSQFSVETWAYPKTNATSYGGVVSSRNWPKGWVIYQGSDNKWQFWVNSGSGMPSTESPTTITPNQWYYIVGTYDGHYAKLYINGLQVAGTAIDGSTFSPNNANPETIGQSNGGSFFFNGVIDDTSIYNHALSLTQIQNHYQAGLSSNSPASPDSEYCSAQNGSCLSSGICSTNGGSSVSLVPACTSTGYASGTVCCVFPTPTPTPTPTPAPTCQNQGGTCYTATHNACLGLCNPNHAYACLQMNCPTGQVCCFP